MTGDGPQFELHSLVQWETRYETLYGTIIRVVQPDAYITREIARVKAAGNDFKLSPGLQQLALFSRPHESYLVLVPIKFGKGVLYWPPVNKLSISENVHGRKRN